MTTTINTTVSLNNLIAKAVGLSRRNKTYKTDAHQFLLNALQYGLEHKAAAGDIVAKVYNSADGTGQQKKLKAWIEEFTGWKVVQKKDKVNEFTLRAKQKEFKPEQWKHKEAVDNPWYQFSTEGDDKPTEVDYEKVLGMVHGIAKRLYKKKEEGKLKINGDVEKVNDLLKAIEEWKTNGH